ncbi:hypothetical protein, partial [Streptomyces bobili]
RARLWSGEDQLTVGLGANGDALDVPRRMRVRQGTDPSAGVWFRQKSSATDNGFVGMQDNSHIGLYGPGGGWGLLMDTADGKIKATSLKANAMQTGTLDAGYLKTTSSPGNVAGNVVGKLGIDGHVGWDALNVNGPVTIKNHPGPNGHTPLKVEQLRSDGPTALEVRGGPVIIKEYSTGVNDYSLWAHQSIYANGHLISRDHVVRVDHPLDPENRNLSHSTVQAPERMTLYDGSVVTDDQGEATVQLPDYVEAFNCDFRYQLTPVGDQPVIAMVAREIGGNSFALRTDRPRTKVCWQVSGTRCDEWASRNRIEAESDKSEEERKTGNHITPTEEPKIATLPGRRGR